MEKEIEINKKESFSYVDIFFTYSDMHFFGPLFMFSVYLTVLSHC